MVIQERIGVKPSRRVERTAPVENIVCLTLVSPECQRVMANVSFKDSQVDENKIYLTDNFLVIVKFILTSHGFIQGKDYSIRIC